ncbi:DUF1385 domain-containing protein [Candidatus Woesearchaeota archaeon]|nr:DUF1385 domain-containing protein [Candidatus Woesearchaeota archaeon]
MKKDRSVRTRSAKKQPEKSSLQSEQRFPVGGQAVIEGVMMKSPHYYSVAVRMPDSTIHVDVKRHISVTEKMGYLNWPFLRGIVSLVEMLCIGMSSIMRSAELASEAIDDSTVADNKDEDKNKSKKADNDNDVDNKADNDKTKSRNEHDNKEHSDKEEINKEDKSKEGNKKEEKLSGFAMAITVAVSFLIGIGLFVLLPYFATYLFGFSEDKNAFIFNAVDGLIKICIFAGYIYAISFLKDIRRTFSYHGSEHKAVNCYEADKILSVENCIRYPTFHPRCGTSFIMFVFFVMILLFSLIPFFTGMLFPGIESLSAVQKRIVYFVVRLLFILPVASVSFEVLKLSYRLKSSWFMRLFLVPGRMFQAMTAKEPDKSMVEVAIAALAAVVEKEKMHKG